MEKPTIDGYHLHLHKEVCLVLPQLFAVEFAIAYDTNGTLPDLMLAMIRPGAELLSYLETRTDRSIPILGLEHAASSQNG